MLHKLKVLLVCSWYWWSICNPCLVVAIGIVLFFLYSGFLIAAAVTAIMAIIAYVFFSFQILRGVPHRLELYYRLSNLYSKYGEIKKSILYELKETLCESRVCDLICQENEIVLI